MPIILKNILAILAGLFVIILFGFVTSLFALNVLEKYNDFTPQNYLPIKILHLFSPILGGFVVGLIVKDKKWLYGALLGVILTIISVSSVSLTMLLSPASMYGDDFPANEGRILARQNILNQLQGAPLTIFLTGLGGYLGEKSIKNKKKNGKAKH